MVVRRGTAAKKAAPAQARRGRPPAKEAAPGRRASKPAQNDVTAYASKAPTDYHKAYARWIVQEVGYDPNEASSLKAAFLAGVSIATAARGEFMKSDYLEQWREEQGIQKRGPKPKSAPEPDESDDDDFDDDDADESDDDDFDEDSDEDSDEDESDDDDFDEDEEETPAPRRGGPAKVATKRAPAKKAAPARGRSRAKDDDEFLF